MLFKSKELHIDSVSVIIMINDTSVYMMGFKINEHCTL